MRFGSVTGAAVAWLAAMAVTVGAAGSARTLSQTQPNPDLPEGEGLKILQASCTACHDLTEVTKFKGFYTREEWRDVVKTMVAYGAKVKESDVEVLVDYLTKNLGKKG